MKIGINARTFSVDEPGGAVQASINLAKELIRHQDHEVVLFGSSSLAAEFDAELYSGGYHDNQIWDLVWERTLLPLLVSKSDIDVLYCPNGNAPLHELEIPVVMCLHDVNAQLGLSSNIHQLYRKLTVPVAAVACDAIVTVSRFSKNEILTVLDLPEDQVHVIYNGIDNRYFRGNSTKINLPDKYLLFVGSLNPRKNISGLLQAYEKVQSEREIELVLIGPSNKDIFQDLEIQPIPGVHRCGYLDALEVKYAYENAEALVFPSYYEGFGLPPVESLACGTPVVAGNRGALPEVLDEAATFVDPDSPSNIAKGITEVLDSSTINKSRLKRQAQKYTWESVAKRLISVIENAV
ncbi:glycosyltransferase family 4 protein [Haloferax namakaokahaiae]|uniref:Glycosyltransferase family 4 protein n=1 Tax=Haloferax namakaokahaiae TaxID=1748331 RepID=A0ABD5ZBU7_9EURY